MSSYLTKRFEAELKKRDIPTTYQQRVKLDADAAPAARRQAPLRRQPQCTKKLSPRWHPRSKISLSRHAASSRSEASK